MMEDMIEMSSSPELDPKVGYPPPSCGKRDPLPIPDTNEGAIDLTDLTDPADSQSSTLCKRAKRRVEVEEASAGTSTSLDIPLAPLRTLRPQVTGHTHNMTGLADSQMTTLHDHIPHSMSALAQETRVLETQSPTPPTIPDSPQMPNRQLAPLEHIPLVHDPLLPFIADSSGVVEESHERLVERVREVFPDVLPKHVFELLAIHETVYADNLFEVVIHILLEDPSYPKDLKGKARARDEGDAASDFEGDVDYTILDANRHLGWAYRTLSLQYLRKNFPHLDLTYTQKILSLHDGQYAATYLYLLEQDAIPCSFVPVAPNEAKGKGTASGETSLDEEEFMKEHSWLVQRLANHHGSPTPGTTSQDMEEDGEEVECGCCFSSFRFKVMAQCTDTHLFCSSCVTSYASAKLGEQSTDLCCMDVSGCKMTFPDSELRRVLPERLFELYEHIRQLRDIELAELEGLEECPFCDYKAVIDVDFETEKVLRCQNEVCEKISCRRCKKEDHLPKSCEEAEGDRALDGKHAIEEAMTRALMRNCPKCQKAFVKEYGCNKMTCTYCRTVSCYVCRSIINGYDHFHENRRGFGQRSESSSKCNLWDTGEGGQAEYKVAAAADRALKEYKALHPDVQEEDIRVQLAVPLPPAIPPAMNIHHDLDRGPRLSPPPAYDEVAHAPNAHVPIARPVVVDPDPFPALPALQAPQPRNPLQALPPVPISRPLPQPPQTPLQ